jgi:hypothetical protein
LTSIYINLHLLPWTVRREWGWCAWSMLHLLKVPEPCIWPSLSLKPLEFCFVIWFSHFFRVEVLFFHLFGLYCQI